MFLRVKIQETSSVLTTLPYSPDLAPSDYRLFPGLKKQLEVHHFSSETEVIATAEIWLDGQPSDFFFSVAWKSWSNGLRSVLSFVGEYVE